MKPWIKWTLAAVVVSLLAAGTLRTLSARKAKQQQIQAQQQAQQTQVSIDLQPTDLVSVKTMDLPLTVPVSGTVAALRSAWVKARVPGELQNLSVREGDRVRAGQVLGRVDPTEAQARLQQARQQAQASKAQVNIAQRTFNNNQSLVTQGFISATALQTAQSSLAAAQATHAAALAAVDLAAKSLDDTVLRAPIAGQVSQRLAQNGERVGVEARVVEIVDLSQLEVQATLSALDAQHVRPGQSALLGVEGAAATLPARLARVNPSATAGSRAIQVYLTLAPGSTLRHGQFVQGTIHVGQQRASAVPLTTLRTDQPEPYLQVVQDGRVQHLKVTHGTRAELDGQTWVAVSGVADGTQVLSGAVGALRESTPVRLLGKN